MRYYDTKLLQTLERFYRANLINSVTGYKSANLLGTINDKGIANLAIFSSVVHLGANPALIGFIQRPLTETSHTYKNIKSNGLYTINHVHQSFVKNAHYTSAKFDDTISEFDTCKLTPEYLKDFIAPFVKESSIKIGLQFVQEIPIEANHTTFIIGKILHLLIEEPLIGIDGHIDLSIAETVASSGLESYYIADKLAQFPHAKIENIPEF
jgi:flavin reductase (DIM6/NTAB) family NADH-FMN oxidoreductase RutF